MSELGVPNFIRDYRKARSLTLEALGNALEPPATKGTISQIESGARGVSLRRLFEIAEVLKTTPGALLDGPAVVPTEDELARMLAAAQDEVGLERLTLGGYPSAVASGLRAYLVRYPSVRSSDLDAAAEPEKVHGEDVQPPLPTKKSARG